MIPDPTLLIPIPPFSSLIHIQLYLVMTLTRGFIVCYTVIQQSFWTKRSLYLSAWCSSCAMELSTASVQEVISCFWFAVGCGSSYLRKNEGSLIKDLRDRSWKRVHYVTGTEIPSFVVLEHKSLLSGLTLQKICNLRWPTGIYQASRCLLKRKMSCNFLDILELDRTNPWIIFFPWIIVKSKFYDDKARFLSVIRDFLTLSF